MNKTIDKILILGSVVITGCSTSVVTPQIPDMRQPLAPPSVESAYRVLPTRSGSATQQAHYQHVYVDSGDPKARSLQTIPLKDAVESNILASSEMDTVQLSGESLKWAVFEKGIPRPTDIEAVGGADVLSGNAVEVNFDVDKTDILNPENLVPLVKKASRVGGTFYVVGYADETGIEAKNETLSVARADVVVDALVQAGINRTRINRFGAGISRYYSSLSMNRRTSVSFHIDD